MSLAWSASVPKMFAAGCILLHRPGDAQRLAVRGLMKLVNDQFRRVLVVETDHHRVPPAVEFRVVIVFPEERDAVPTDRPNFLRHHEEPELSPDRRPAPAVRRRPPAGNGLPGAPFADVVAYMSNHAATARCSLLKRQTSAARSLSRRPFGCSRSPRFKRGGLCSMDVPTYRSAKAAPVQRTTRRTAPRSWTARDTARRKSS